MNLAVAYFNILSEGTEQNHSTVDVLRTEIRTPALLTQKQCYERQPYVFR
jgi:hypothetical protein